MKIMKKKDKVALNEVLEKLKELSRMPYRPRPNMLDVELIADSAILILRKVLKESTQNCPMTASEIKEAAEHKLLRLGSSKHSVKACERALKKERLAWASIVHAVDDIRAAHIEFSNAFIKSRNWSR